MLLLLIYEMARGRGRDASAFKCVCAKQTPGYMQDEKDYNDVELYAAILFERFDFIPFASAEAEDLKTTEDVAKILESHRGQEIERHEVRAALESCAAYSKLIGDKFYWVLRKKR